MDKNWVDIRRLELHKKSGNFKKKFFHYVQISSFFSPLCTILIILNFVILMIIICIYPGAEERIFSKGGPNKKKNEILSFSKKFTI